MANGRVRKARRDDNNTNYRPGPGLATGVIVALNGAVIVLSLLVELDKMTEGTQSVAPLLYLLILPMYLVVLAFLLSGLVLRVIRQQPLSRGSSQVRVTASVLALVALLLPFV